MEGNITLVLEDICSEEQILDGISHDEMMKRIEKQIQHELSKEDNTDAFLANEMHYALNHTIKSLRRIAEYYGMSFKRKKKAQLIELIVAFESDKQNAQLVLRRRILWSLIGVIQGDKYLNKYIMFD